MNYYLHFKIKSKLILGLIALISIVSVSVTTHAAPKYSFFVAQQLSKKITINATNVSVREVIYMIQKQCRLNIVIQDAEIDKLDKINFQVKDKTGEEALNLLLARTPYTFKAVGDNITITKRSTTAKENFPLKGRVFDQQNRPIVGATILMSDSNEGAISDENGNFIIKAITDHTLEISFIGMKPEFVAIHSNMKEKELKVMLKNDAVAVEDVIVTGYFSRKVDSYTGNANVIKGNDLRAVNPTNVMKAIAFLDPDIVFMEDNAFGSDPNKAPSIHIQGTSSITTAKDAFIDDPNLPTFILDGFEVKYQTIYDMDPVRIESIVILKDAAATAVYGSRAANGVIVITTVAPKPGKVELSYNMNLTFSSPDLSSYDLLNAREKAELETLANLRSPSKAPVEYNKIRQWIAGGTDTDWLAQPTRNAAAHRHSLNLMGGEKSVRYNLNFSYDSSPGVMKKSKRTNYGVTADIIYRPSDKLNFKNSVTYAKNSGTDSPYGLFSDYTQLNPYFPIYDVNGKMFDVYETQSGSSTYPFPGVNKNPLIETDAGNFSKSKYSNFIENFMMDWRFVKDLRLTVSLAYSEKNYQSDRFISPNSVTYKYTEDMSQKGSYTLTNEVSTSFNGKAALAYTKYIGKHQLLANLGGEMSISNNERFSHEATGFGSSYMDDISYAAKYKDGSVPSAVEGTVRTLGAYLSVNYTFDNRFLFDGSIRFDGSSQFGSEKRVAPFFSLGVGWNLHNEKFLKESKIINLLKVRATYGETGSVKFSAYQAQDTYSYYKDDRYLGNMGLYMLALGNENLKWQKTNQYEIGLNAGLFKDIITLSANYYYKDTQNLLYDVILPSSTGFKSYVENLGQMVNKGVTFSVRASLLRSKEASLSIFLNGNHNRNTNHSQYKNGESITAIYAVESLGIDPVTGNELYRDRFGNPTWVFDPLDKRVLGNTDPDLQGSFGVNARYKQFSASLGFSYSIGAEEYNSTIESKVENATLYNNVDRRVLTDTWKKPGDIAKFGRLDGPQIKETSRFVQQNDFLKFTSLSLSYDFNRDGFIKKLKLTGLKLTFNTNDLVYWSTMRRERGTSYPFARSYSFGLSANF